MGYGADVRAPMEIPQEPPSYFSQVPAPLPEMQDASVGNLRLAGTLAKRLPPMPSGDLQDLSFTNSKQIEAAELMNDIRASFDISRQQRSNSKAIQKEIARRKENAIKGGERAGRTRQRQAQRANMVNKDRMVKHFARNILGMGTDTYR